MSKKYLGEQIDIHAGGEDLIFPHHENEIAQSEAANGKEFSRYWMHNGFLNIDNRKMSKSLGNFFTVREISEKYDLQVLRFFMLSAHYRNPVNFSHDLMESAKNGLDRILTAVDNLRHLSENAKDVPMTEDEKKIIASIDDIYKKFEDSMDDDFKRLFADVRKHRSGMDIKITPSAREDVDLLAVAEKLIREDFYADDQMVITISHMGYIKRTPLADFHAQNRGGVGSKGSETRDEDFIEHILSLIHI